MNEIDTGALRSAARKIGGAAAWIEEISADVIPAMERGLESDFSGEAAQALAENLDEIKKEARDLGDGLAAIKKDLLAYVEQVEEADRRAKRAIESR